jgi:hypothetical protein
MHQKHDNMTILDMASIVHGLPALSCCNNSSLFMTSHKPWVCDLWFEGIYGYVYKCWMKVFICWKPSVTTTLTDHKAPTFYLLKTESQETVSMFQVSWPSWTVALYVWGSYPFNMFFILTCVVESESMIFCLKFTSSWWVLPWKYISSASRFC